MRYRYKRIAPLLAALMIFQLSGCTPIDGVPVETDASAAETSVFAATGGLESAAAFVAASGENDEQNDTLLPEVKPKLPPDLGKFDEALAAAMEKYEIKGLTAALFKDGEVIYVKPLGLADTEDEIPCTENTRYRVASISKTVSAMVTMTLYDKGVIAPEDILSEKTGISYDDPACKEKVQLWHLLTHTAGIADTYNFDSVATYMKSDINDLLSEAHTGSEPGRAYLYSNFGAGSIGALVERITGEFFYDYADEALFKPLSMDAGYIIDKITDKESCAKLYDHDGEIFDVKNWGRKAEYYDSFGLGNSYYVAQCELIITAPDLARLGIALADGGETGGVRLLSEEAVGLMHKRWFSAEDFDVGLCIRIYDDLIEGRTIYGHPGNALGAITGMFYDPTDRSGAVLLTNHCLQNVDDSGFYKANKEMLTAAYEYVFDRM